MFYVEIHLVMFNIVSWQALLCIMLEIVHNIIFFSNFMAECTTHAILQLIALCQLRLCQAF